MGRDSKSRRDLKKKKEARQEKENQETNQSACATPRGDLPQQTYNPITYSKETMPGYDDFMGFLQSQAPDVDLEEVGKKRIVKLASRGDTAVLVLDKEGFPEIEMKLSCIYVLIVTVPNFSCIQAIDGNEWGMMSWTYDGNGCRLEIGLDQDAHNQILRCKTAQRGCSFDILRYEGHRLKCSFNMLFKT